MEPTMSERKDPYAIQWWEVPEYFVRGVLFVLVSWIMYHQTAVTIVVVSVALSLGLGWLLGFLF